jgi:hypothetical protein
MNQVSRAGMLSKKAEELSELLHLLDDSISPEQAKFLCVCVCVCTCVCVRVCVRACIYTHISLSLSLSLSLTHTHTHIFWMIQSPRNRQSCYKCMCVYVCVYIPDQPYVRMYSYVREHAKFLRMGSDCLHIHACSGIYLNTYTHNQIYNLYTHAHTCKCADTYAYTHTDTYIYTYLPEQAKFLRRGSDYTTKLNSRLKQAKFLRMGSDYTTGRIDQFVTRIEEQVN